MQLRTREVLVHGVFARWMRRRHWADFVLPVPFYGALMFHWLNKGETAPLWFARVHAQVHAAQIKEHGPVRYCFKYLWLLLRHGYRKHPLEIAAYKAVDAEASRRYIA